LETFVRQHYRADVPDILEAVIRTMGTTSEALAAKYRPYLEVDDLAQADPEFVEFGNHTDTHPVLSALADGQQMVEIGAASRKLHEWTGRAPISFAYPFGLKAHYTARTKDHIRATGHKAILDMRRRMWASPVKTVCAGIFCPIHKENVGGGCKWVNLAPSPPTTITAFRGYLG